MRIALASVLSSSSCPILKLDWASGARLCTLRSRPDLAQRKRAGTPADFHDTAIAGIVLARRATFATRNRRHFSDAGISLFDLWTA
jgi:predicted nucleic acid-binding protein